MSREVVTGSALNTNSTQTVTASMNVEGIEHVGLHLKQASGSHAQTVWVMYCSPNNTNWFITKQTTSAQDAGVNTAELFDCRGTQYIRFQVAVASVGAGTADITIIA